MNTYSERNFIADHGGFNYCGIFKASTCTKVERHTHEFIEIIYILHGRATQHINNSSFEVNRGDLIFINYNSTHAFEPKGRFEYVNIGFKSEELINKIKDMSAFAASILINFDNVKNEDERIITFYGQERRELEMLLGILLIENKQTRMFKEQNMASCLNVLLSLIVEKVRFSAERKDDLKALQKYIEENLEEKIGLTDLANYCFYNPSYFSRIFKERFGVTLSTYLKQLRVERAKDLLRKKKSISEILDRTGFSSKKMLYKSFLEIEGITLAEWRKKEVNHV